MTASGPPGGVPGDPTLPGLIIMYFSGAAAGLLGIGAGIFKVPAMDQVMRMPFKASTATSNFMIGVTAASGAVVYFARGDVKPLVAGPVVLGVLVGALIGRPADGEDEDIHHPQALHPAARLHGHRDDLPGGERMTPETHHEAPSRHEPIEMVLARLLRFGSIIAAILLAVGIGAMLLGQTGFAPRLITAGLLTLLATPIMRVVVAGLIFARDRDWRFAFFCLVVLCALVAGVLLGHGHGE